MSWLKSAVSKAREAGNKSNLTRAVKSYADTVVQQAGQAVAEGAKILQDRIGNRNFRSVKQTVKRLEAAAISCRGSERVLLLKRWLLVLKEVDTLTRVSSEEKQKTGEQPDSIDEATDNIKKLSTVLYYDSDIGGEPMTFRDVFLKSQALEGITLSAILQAPSEEEVSLLMELYGLCLTGAKEVHIAILSSIQDLAAALASYHDEVLVKQEELLQFAQAAITGLKISADLGRLDLEAKDLKKQLEELTSFEKQPSKDHEKESSKTNKPTVEALKEAFEQIRICSRLEEILIRKKNLSLGDSPEIHAQKIDKLKVLSESLANSTAKSEKRILEQRSQKEEALKVRVSKADEANEKEKEIAAEISVLEQQRDKLEAELKKVNISLAAANARLHNAREERDQFDVANNQIIEHWATKEVELSKSIMSCKVEKDVISTWINFMEDTWVLQHTYAEIKEETDDDLKDHEHYFLNLAIHLLSDYKKELGPWINQIEKFVVNLRKLSERSEISSADDENSTASHRRKNLEEQYLECETKIISTFSIVDYMRDQFHSSHGANSRKDNARVKELFEDIEKLRAGFESIERPTLELENPTPPPKAEETAAHKTPKTSTEQSSPDTTSSPKHQSEHPQLPTVEAQQVLDHAAELAKLESEFGKHSGDYSTEEIGDWEFDELERELRGDETARNK